VVDRQLSTLELTALGVVWKKGGCTAYAVMKEFADSHAHTYRSGAGSIYPLLKRLTVAGYLAGENGRLSITDSGVEALRSWALLSESGSEISSNLDPLRSRVYFLDVLSLEEKADFIDSSMRALKKLVKSAKTTCEAYRREGQLLSALAMRGAVLEAEARIRFMQELRKELQVP
jgi:DNA-binding PadR family transcriptional regulator